MQSRVLCFEICLLKTHKKATRRSRRSYQRYAGDDGDNNSAETEYEWEEGGVVVR